MHALYSLCVSYLKHAANVPFSVAAIIPSHVSSVIYLFLFLLYLWLLFKASILTESCTYPGEARSYEFWSNRCVCSWNTAVSLVLPHTFVGGRERRVSPTTFTSLALGPGPEVVAPLGVSSLGLCQAAAVQEAQWGPHHMPLVPSMLRPSG